VTYAQKFEKYKDSQVLWLTLVIPATWEAEIGRIKVQMPGQMANKTPFPK
jgi:hypothetical protein